MKFMTRLTTMILFITILGMPVGGMVSATMTIPMHNVIIVMDNYDTVISDAVNTLKNELDQQIVIRFGTFKFLWITAFKSMDNAIFVGHGVKDKEVVINKQLVSWHNFGKIANSLRATKIDFLICGSVAVKQYIPADRLGITFDHAIDARFGALYISVIIKIQTGLFNQAITTIQSLKTHISLLRNNEIFTHTLGKFCGSEWDSMYYLLASIALIIFPLTLGALGLWSAAKVTALFTTFLVGVGTTLYVVSNFFSAIKDKRYVDAFVYFISTMIVIIGLIESIIAGYGYLIRIAANSAKAIEQVASLTWPKMMLIAAGVAFLIVSIVGLLSDLADNDCVLFSREASSPSGGYH